MTSTRRHGSTFRLLDEIELETVQLLRDAFFGPVEMVPAHKASGRIAAEQITPYPPGIPAVVPGERLTDAVVDYLRTGLAAGMTCPDPADRRYRRSVWLPDVPDTPSFVYADSGNITGE